jgi:soluble lytic murein transglycosylase-like protein
MHRNFVRRAGIVVGALYISLGLLLAFCSHPSSAATGIPQSAHSFRSELVRNARMVWGLDAPIALFAAQVHQESAWKPDAVSRVGAQGLAQFMPATAAWISTIYPELENRTPTNPTWALRALVQYDRWLFERLSAADKCERMAMVLSAYNGGLGWVYRDKDMAQTGGARRDMWWGHVERFNGGRSTSAFAENRAYPRQIIHRHQALYMAWGPGVCV